MIEVLKYFDFSEQHELYSLDEEMQPNEEDLSMGQSSPEKVDSFSSSTGSSIDVNASSPYNYEPDKKIAKRIIPRLQEKFTLLILLLHIRSGVYKQFKHTVVKS